MDGVGVQNVQYLHQRAGAKHARSARFLTTREHGEGSRHEEQEERECLAVRQIFHHLPHPRKAWGSLPEFLSRWLPAIWYCVQCYLHLFFVFF